MAHAHLNDYKCCFKDSTYYYVYYQYGMIVLLTNARPGIFLIFIRVGSCVYILLRMVIMNTMYSVGEHGGVAVES